MTRLRVAKGVLWFIVGGALVAGLSRFINGLGASTNLTDLTPWGFWIGFDVMGGVALAAGGFVISAVAHVFHLKGFKAIVRAAVLTAMLGYMAVVVGLMFDLGRPWNILHMIVWWNPHSPLFEVGWCVMLYLAVLIIEFLPVVLELAKRPLLQRIHRVLQRFSLAFIILGIMLSTLHQSSLGSLFLIQPHRLHPLWHTPLLPVLFFLSAVALGLMMVTAESLTTSWLYEKQPETPLLRRLGGAAFWVLFVYLVVRFGDLALRDKLPFLFAGGFEGRLFWIEILLSTLVPMAIFSVPRARNSATGLRIGATCVVSGMVLNRIDVGGLAMVGVTGTRYIPSWTELLVSAGVVAGAALVFFFFVERFRVWEEPAYSREAWETRRPRFHPTTLTWLGDPSVGDLSRFSLLFVLAAALAFTCLPSGAVWGPEAQARPVFRARGAERMVIDGDRDGDRVLFDHREHLARVRRILGVADEDGTCPRCHHMNVPLDDATSCAVCHADMARDTDIFDHDRHVAAAGGTAGCTRCHEDAAVAKRRDTAKPCLECHEHLVAQGAVFRPAGDDVAPASGYAHAMHRLCVGCHQEQVQQGRVHDEQGKLREDLPWCGTCHTGPAVPLDPESPDRPPAADPARQGARSGGP